MGKETLKVDQTLSSRFLWYLRPRFLRNLSKKVKKRLVHQLLPFAVEI